MEGDAEVRSHLGAIVNHRLVKARQYAADACRGVYKRGRFSVNNFVVGLTGKSHVAAVVEFQNFADDKLVCGIGDDGRDVCGFVDDATHGLRKHVVANEYGYLRSPFAVGGLLPASNVGPVDDVVMDQACEVQQFYGGASVSHAVEVGLFCTAICK